MKKLIRIMVVTICIILIFTLCMYKSNSKAEFPLREEFTNVKIIDNRNNMQKLYDNPELEEYVIVDMIIGDRYYSNVGIRTKGSAIYSWLKAYKSNKFSYKVKLDYINRNQEYKGIKEIHLNSQAVDISEIREYIVYEVCNEMGLYSQQYGLGTLQINNKKIGLITLVEVITEDFVEDKYNSKNGNLYKTETDFVFQKYGAELQYKGDNIASYPALLDKAKSSNTTIEDKQRLVYIVKKLNTANTTQEIEECFIDFDRIIKYVAINKALSNMDSFIGKNIRNSYLYEENGKIDIIPFDFNLSLGNKYSSWSPEEINSVELIEVRYKIHSKIVDTILENEEYHQKYKEYLKQTLNKLQQLYNQGLIDKLYKQVDETVRDGTEKVHAYEEFLQEKKVLEDFIINRMDTLEYDYLRTN